jgi:hypothetical protein
VVDSVALGQNRCRNSMISIPALVLLEERTDAVLQARIFIPALKYLLLVIANASGQAGHLKEVCERITLP